MRIHPIPKNMNISVVCHFHSEPHALPGFISEAEKTFDQIVLVSSAPDGVKPDEETIEIAKKSGHKLIYDTISQGFGALRSRCISYGGGDFTCILDADERIFASVPHLRCSGTGKFPETTKPDLKVSQIGTIDQRSLLREQFNRLRGEDMALCVSRRHWFGAPGEFGRPCQNWNDHPDWQLRLLRNSQWICYDPDVKMHERLVFTPTWSDPLRGNANLDRGVFIDHFSHHFRAMEPEQNSEDIAIYESLQPGVTQNMWISHQPRK